MRHVFAAASLLVALTASGFAQDTKTTVGVWIANGAVNIAGMRPIAFDTRPIAVLAEINSMLADAPIFKEDISQAWWPPTICDRPAAREVCSFSGTVVIPKHMLWILAPPPMATALPK